MGGAPGVSGERSDVLVDAIEDVDALWIDREPNDFSDDGLDPGGDPDEPVVAVD